MTLLSQKYLPSDYTPDIADIGDVAGYTHLLLILSRIPADNTAAPDPRELAMAMRRWSDSIRRQMPHYAPEHLGRAIECYDISHRLGYNERPDSRTIDEYRRQYFDSCTSRQRPNQRVGHLRNGIPKGCRRPRRCRQPAVWRLLQHTRAMDETTALQHGICRNHPGENYRRLSLVMPENLRPWFRFDQRSRKRQW